ncbi:hypothetical protein JF531_07735 [Microbacterium esteraromaticum]|uniref:hypothetical protein n=1 Tax=Microbacterium esteraromaticum TaxID=57043 RepID=UPI001A8E1B9C|nr:hypothetical protein [Microbacterium esteraromaticum]MBN8424411.1 hypothetical protein [Microbacterium esteraromaticum]
MRETEGGQVVSIQEAEIQAGGIQAPLDGNSSAMQQIGNIESDSNPERMPAVGLAHPMNAIGQLITLVDGLQAAVDDLKQKSAPNAPGCTN